MKTIEQAAKEWANAHYPKCGTNDWADDGFDEGYNAAANYKALDAFEAGAEFAQRWIPVTEELPETRQWALVKLLQGDIRTDQYLGNKWWLYDGHVTHWRHIELK